MDGKMKEIIMLLLEPSTEEDLQEMLKEPQWSEGAKDCMRETLELRKAKTSV